MSNSPQTIDDSIIEEMKTLGDPRDNYIDLAKLDDIIQNAVLPDQTNILDQPNIPDQINIPDTTELANTGLISKSINTLSTMRHVKPPLAPQPAKERVHSKEMIDALLGKKPIPRSAETLPIPGGDHVVMNKYIGKESNYSRFLCYEKKHPDAAMPKRQTQLSVGYDLCACAPGTIPAWGSGLVDIGITIAMPKGVYGRIAPRSGLAVKNNIEVGAGVIDPDYRGEVKVLLRNFSDIEYNYQKGDRVAQLVLERCETPEVRLVTSIDDLFGRSARNTGGFGSTGH